MGIKISEMPTATTVSQGDLMMVVQDGENKKVDASMFQLAEDASAVAETLNGYSDEDFVKTDGTAANSAKLGGVEATLYATKEYVDARTDTTDSDPTWCCPKPWFSTTTLPNNDEEHWAFCDGKAYDPEELPELFAIIGYQFTRDANGVMATSGKFKLPDLNGRFLLGAHVGTGQLATKSLPSGVYTNEQGDFTEDGQYIIPNEVGKEGGDPVTTQMSQLQIASHKHSISSDALAKGAYTKTGSAGSAAYASDNWNDAEITVGYTGVNGTSVWQMNKYPQWTQYGIEGRDVNNNAYGMLSMPPYVSFAWIMRIKPADK